MLKELAIYNPSTEELLCIALVIFVVFAAGWFLGCMYRLGEFDEQQTTFPGALSEREARDREAVEKGAVGQWPVVVGSDFFGAEIIGADYTNRTVTLQWRGPQEAGEGGQDE